MDDVVNSARCDDYAGETVKRAMREAIEGSGYRVPSGVRVLIKPNILSQNVPEQHCITHPAIVRALCEAFLDRGCSVSVGESISFWQRGLTRRAFETSGIAAVARDLGVRLVPFDESDLLRVTDGCTETESLYIPREALECDVLVSAAKLKTHSGLGLSGAVKNLFGILPGGYKQLMHLRTENDYRLSDVFLDILAVTRPTLAVMDAVMGLDGGPSAAGTPRFVGRVLASTNPAALDVAACSMIGADPRLVTTLVRAEERGFVVPASVRLEGDLPGVRFRAVPKTGAPLSPNRDTAFVRETSVRPVIRKSRCVDCGLCSAACTPNAIVSGPDRMPRVDDGHCIHCYVCVSRCPHGAIGFARSPMNRLIGAARGITGI